MRINSESEIGLTGPVFQVVSRLESCTGEVGNLILLYSRLLESRTGGFIELGCLIIVRDKVRVIFCAAGNQFTAKARVFIHFEHINAYVRCASGDRLVN